MIELGLLQVNGLIFHHIPARPGGIDPASEGGPVLSAKQHAMPDKLEFYIRDQVARTFLRSSQAVSVDQDADSVVPVQVATCLGTMDNSSGTARVFVSVSQTIATQLYNCQHGNAPSGLLVVAHGTAGGNQVLIIAKLEQQSGLSFEVEQVRGIQTVQVALEDGLVLTDKTEVFKAAVFVLNSSSELEGVVSDEQSGNVYSAPITDYWLRAFLGCKYANSADVQTRAFIKGVNSAINSDISDINERDRAFDALGVELASNRRVIKPQKWVEENIAADSRDAVMARLREAGVPTSQFPKSAEVAERAPKYRWYEFSDGRKVKVPLDREVELVTHGEDSSKEDVLTMRGKIVRIR